MLARIAHQGANPGRSQQRNHHPIVRVFLTFPGRCWVALLHSWRFWEASAGGDALPCTCASALFGKFHPLTLGLHVSITESECTSFAASLRNSQREGEKVAFPHIKRELNKASEPQSQQVTSPQGGRKTFLGFLSVGAKNSPLQTQVSQTACVVAWVGRTRHLRV